MIKDKVFSADIIAIDSGKVEKIKSVLASELSPKRQRWLWENYIPYDTCTLFAGSGGVGKSQLLMNLASMVSNGSSFSINSLSYQIDHGKILILSAEDDEQATLVPRLMAAKANLSNIHFLQSVLVEFESERFIALDKDIYLLEKMLDEISDVKLIIIDPITAYIGNVRENHASEVRNFILRLRKLAKERGIAIILNTHVRKKSVDAGGGAVDEILGSIAWSTTVRSAFAIVRHPEDEEKILFMSSKTNFKKPEPLAFKIVSQEIVGSDEKVETSAIEWLNYKVNIGVEEASNKKLYEAKTKSQLCKDVLIEILSFGGMKLEEILIKVREEGISDETLYRTARELKIFKGKTSVGKSFWSLSPDSPISDK